MDEKDNHDIPSYIKELVAAKHGRANQRGKAGVVGTEFGSSPLLVPTAPTLIYLRVSTKGQLDTALDIDPKGLSIATQQSECVDKVAAVGGELAHPPFIEPGISAKDVSHRPVFKQMLAYIHAHPDIKYVVTYNRARAFRNHVDAAIHVAQLQKLGVRLITVKDDFGEGPAATAMEGMLDVMNGLMNTMNGLDVAAKMGYKATHGGTIGRARLGYLNAKKEVDGKQIATVILDPKRAALVKKAWELYATGTYSLDRLEATLADMGLTARPSSRNPHEHPVSANKLHQMFADPYYLGYIVYKDDIYRGNHEPLVNEALFQKVQEVRDLRSAKGQRDRVHQHYLKGGLFCQRCHAQGRTSRLIFTQHTGRAGKKYSYFVCRGRQDGLCDLPHLRIEAVEDAVVEHYHTLQLPTTFIDDIRGGLDEALADHQGATKELHASLSRRLRDLDRQENQLVDALADSTLPGDKIRAKLRDITLQKDRIKLGLADTVGSTAGRALPSSAMQGRERGLPAACVPATGHRAPTWLSYRRLAARALIAAGYALGASAVGERPACLTGNGECLVVLLLGEVSQGFHARGVGGEGEFALDDGQLGLPNVGEDPFQVRRGMVPARARRVRAVAAAQGGGQHGGSALQQRGCRARTGDDEIHPDLEML
ncbi:recombinase family protein [Nocardia wallacei]|uniref:recombinase family protein n=1 Tax=Nocardia wallacei TaxID=480035 RepID=UPI002454AD4A|nr:recombinase family protein [Nocardia wallacei]